MTNSTFGSNDTVEHGSAGMTRASAADTEVITPGQVQWIERKAKGLSLDATMITAMFTRLKLTEKPWAQLTGAEFAVVKAELARASAL